MKVTIEIECDNAAFDDDLSGELSRILGGCVDKAMILLGRAPGVLPGDYLCDTNGNCVGKMVVGGSDLEDKSEKSGAPNQPHTHCMGVMCACCGEIFCEDSMVGNLCMDCCHGPRRACGSSECYGNYAGHCGEGFWGRV